MDNISKSRDEKLMKQVDQIDNLRREQANGSDKMPMIPANRTINVNPPTELNVSEVKAIEAERFVHIFTRVRHDDPANKKYTNQDSIIHIHVGEFDRKVEQKYFQLFDEVQVFHDPRANAPTSYVLKEVKGKTEPAAPAVNGNAQLNARVQELKNKEKELLNAQAALEQRQADLDKREADLQAQSKAIEDAKAASSPETTSGKNPTTGKSVASSKE